MLVRCWKCGRMISADLAQRRETPAGFASGPAGAAVSRSSIDLCPKCVPQFDAYLPLAKKITFLIVACCTFGVLTVFGYILWLYGEQTHFWFTVVWLVLLVGSTIGFTWAYFSRFR